MNAEGHINIPGIDKQITVAQAAELGVLYAAWILKPGMAKHELSRLERALWRTGITGDPRCPTCQSEPCACERVAGGMTLSAPTPVTNTEDKPHE